MKRLILILCLGVLGISCQNKSENKDNQVSKEEKEEQLAQEQFSQIDLSEVDTYPTFSQCADSLSAEEKLSCFRQNILKLYANALQKHDFKVGESIHDTINIFLKIENDGKIIFEKSQPMSEKTREAFPALDSILSAETQTFEPIIPAKKNNVNVSIQSVFPLFINVE